MKANAHEIIKEKRLKLGLSQKELAEKAGLSHNTIYNLELFCNSFYQLPNACYIYFTI